MALTESKVYTVTYTLKNENGDIIDQADKDNPFMFMSNANQVLPQFEKEVSGLLIGGQKDFKINAADGYGEFKQEAIQVINRSEFPEGMELQEGMQMVANTPDGHQLPFVIQKIDGDNITIDFNHPLAGEDLHFDVSLIDVREATEEEKAHGHVHHGGDHNH